MKEWCQNLKQVMRFFQNISPNKSFVLNIFTLSLGVILFALITFKSIVIIKSPQAQAGKLDLSNWDFQSDGIASLNGEWAFFWRQFADNEDQISPDDYVNVPDVWNNYNIDGFHPNGSGYATFVLNITGLSGNICIKIPPCSTSYELYINNHLMAHNGAIGKSDLSAVPDYNPETITFFADQSDVTIKIFVSNFTYARGGIWYPLLIGTKEQIDGINRGITYREVFVIGGIATIILFGLFAYTLGINKDSLKYFLLMLLLSGIRIMIYGDYFLIHMIGSFRWAVIAEYSTLTLLPMMIALFLQSLMGKKSRLLKIAIILEMCFFVCILFMPLHQFTKFTLFLEVWAAGISIYSTICLILSKYRYRYLIAAGSFIFIFTGIIDALYHKCVITAVTDESPMGLYLFVCFWGVALVKQIIDEKGKSIEADKKAQQAKFAYLQSQIRPHFLYNTLDAIANVCEKDGKAGSDLIVDLAHYLRRKLEFFNLEELVTLETELDFVNKYFSIEKSRFGEKIHLEYDIQIPLSTKLPTLILQPLVENAIRHGISAKTKGGCIYIRACSMVHGATYTVKDDGIGMQAEKLALVLSEEEANSGVGIINIHKRLLCLYGKGLSIESEYGKGTCITFFIPEVKSDD